MSIDITQNLGKTIVKSKLVELYLLTIWSRVETPITLILLIFNDLGENLMFIINWPKLSSLDYTKHSTVP